MSKEYSEKIALNGSTIAQFQSRATKAFAALGWKLENFTKVGMSASIPQKRKDDRGYGKVDIFFSGHGCLVTYTLANPPALMAGTLAKNSLKPFLAQVAKETADESANDPDAHEKAMTAALMEANRKERERLAAKAAREARIKQIKMIFRCILPVVGGIVGLASGGGLGGFCVGFIGGLVLNEILICYWKMPI